MGGLRYAGEAPLRILRPAYPLRDRFVGPIEPRIDREASALPILGVWRERGVRPHAEPGLSEAMAAALEAHREFAGVDRIQLPRGLRTPIFGIRNRAR